MLNPLEILRAAQLAGDLEAMDWYGDARYAHPLNPLGFVRIVVTEPTYGQWLVGHKHATVAHGGAQLERKYEYPGRQLFGARKHSEAMAEELAKRDIESGLVEQLTSTRLDHSSFIRACRQLDGVQSLSVEDVLVKRKLFIDVKGDELWLAPSEDQDPSALFDDWRRRGIEVKDGRARLGKDADALAPYLAQALRVLEESPARYLVCRRADVADHWGY